MVCTVPLSTSVDQVQLFVLCDCPGENSLQKDCCWWLRIVSGTSIVLSIWHLRPLRFCSSAIQFGNERIWSVFYLVGCAQDIFLPAFNLAFSISDFAVILDFVLDTTESPASDLLSSSSPSDSAAVKEITEDCNFGILQCSGHTIRNQVIPNRPLQTANRSSWCINCQINFVVV